MKWIAYVLALVKICSAHTLLAEGAQSSVSSLPVDVFLISEPIANGAPGTSAIYDISRNAKSVGVLFSKKADAEAFMKALQDAKDHNRSVVSFPRSFIRDAEKEGHSYLLDPANPLVGGVLVVSNLDLENAELTEICDQDQADRHSEPGKQIDSSIVAPRDVKRLARVKELYLSGKFSAASDYFHAALVLQHGSMPDDFLLAHELAIVAVRKGYQGTAAWLVAASEDRFLQSIGRKQRFGTQLSNPIVVDGNVTDGLRDELSVPSLNEEKKRSQGINQPTPNQSEDPTP